MIKVKILGYKDKVERDKFRRSAMFFIERLMPRKQRLDITIKMDPYLLTRELMSGSCEPDDEAVNHRHYEFTICIDANLTLDDKLSILAHELTHVRQYTSGQMYSSARNSNITYWEGKAYDDTKIDYDDQLWEKDAVKQEEILREELKQNDIWK